ncbi:glycosyltransferase family 2 protein [Actinomycetospora lemnae]|uniref:Glycosyltransferase family 2 protein n=1 Tax=Actinomycetospora lemnae TaxID=3019891 RepID=A0ABT5SXQ2_9PSEU|nr:glycosyltransferase family 2 protein [Actinomycetospora sp. DW7H6]MDD7966782.1 glycosyltransferase family 2 protein [Actinomycetospora sp. DW7H6]
MINVANRTVQVREAPERNGVGGRRTVPGPPTVSVVIPARNEAANLPSVLRGLSPSYEVILVDGGSVDDTIGVTRRCRPDALIVQQTRRGKGNALACGFAAATGDIIVMLDADGSADPAEIPDFVRMLVAGAHYAKGTRRASGGGSEDITVLRSLGNQALTAVVNRLFGVRYTDLCYGYNAFWAGLVPIFDLPSPAAWAGDDEMLWGDGFEVETLINIRVAAAGASVAEVGSVERPRLHGVSNLNAARDGLRVLRTILNERQRARHNPSVPAQHLTGPACRPVGPSADEVTVGTPGAAPTAIAH